MRVISRLISRNPRGKKTTKRDRFDGLEGYISGQDDIDGLDCLVC